MTKIRKAKPKKMATPKKKKVIYSPKSQRGAHTVPYAPVRAARAIKRKVKKVVSKVQVSRLKKKQAKKKKK